MHAIRSLLFLLSTLFWLALVQAQETPTIELTRSELDWLAANPEILIGSDASWQPFVWRQEDGRRTYQGHYYGISKRLPLLSAILDKSQAKLPAAKKQRIWDRWFTHAVDPGEVELSAEERAYLDATVFRRARSTDWMPFDFSDRDGTPIGIGEDYWGLIRDKLGLKETTTDRQPFSAILAAIDQGKTDIYAATTRTGDRGSYADFSDAYENYPIAIATAHHAGLITSTSSL